MVIVLLGARGCGKSTIGRAVARRVGLPFVDLDELTLRRFSESSVIRVWQRWGESAWRDAEAAALAEAIDLNRAVIALGGGTPMISSARSALAERGRIGRALLIYLRCDPEELARRLQEAGGGGGGKGGAGDRPSLTGLEPAAEVRSVLAEREPVYRELAELELDVTEGSPEEAAVAIERLIAERRGWERGEVTK